eukprot:3425918-Amphidinium_carterae.3
MPVVLESHVPRLPELPNIPSDAMAQTVDPSNFPMFGEWKKAMCAVPFAIARDAQIMESYLPIGNNVIGFEMPVNNMSALRPASDNPIPWNPECVQPPYENFYLDGCRFPPCNERFTGYEGLPMDYKGPMVEEEYWNRMIGLWKGRNEAPREQAQMRADMMGVPLEFGEFGEMPYYKKVPEFYRVRRFQLGKLQIMLKDREEEMEAIRKRASDEEDAIAESLREAENASRHITAEALSQLGGLTS